MTKELEVLFNSKIRPKILKFLFQNEGNDSGAFDIAKKIQVLPRIARGELEKLTKIKIVEKKARNGKIFYFLSDGFPFLSELKSFILKASPLSLLELNNIFKNAKGFKLVVVSGIFLQEKKSPIDLLMVGGKINNSKVSAMVKKIESDVGKEIRWSLMTIEEFGYRSEMHDRFLKEVFERPHKTIIDKLTFGDGKKKIDQTFHKYISKKK